MSLTSFHTTLHKNLEIRFSFVNAKPSWIIQENLIFRKCLENVDNATETWVELKMKTNKQSSPNDTNLYKSLHKKLSQIT